jgi:hypothetical protein
MENVTIKMKLNEQQKRLEFETFNYHLDENIYLIELTNLFGNTTSLCSSSVIFFPLSFLD